MYDEQTQKEIITYYRDRVVYNVESPSCLSYKISDRSIVVGGVVGSFNHKNNYWNFCSKFGTIKVHRLIWMIHFGVIADDYVVDHINGDTKDNRLENLRCINRRLSARNKKKLKNNSTGINGLSFHRDRRGDVVYEKYIFRWVDNDTKTRKQKVFSCTRLGKDIAFQKAKDFAENKTKELKDSDLGYTERHGV